MQRYQNAALDALGNVIQGMTVSVFLQGTQTLATIFSDNGVTLKANPTTTDALGNFFFYAANAHYDIQLTKTGLPTTQYLDIILFDPFSGGGTSLVSGQVLFGGPANAIAQDSGFVWDNVNKRLDATMVRALGGTPPPSGTSGVQLWVNTNQAAIDLINSTQAANSKIWEFISIGSTLTGRAVDDAYSTVGNWITVSRSGTSISNITIPKLIVGSDPGSTYLAKFGFDGTATNGVWINDTAAAGVPNILRVSKNGSDFLTVASSGAVSLFGSSTNDSAATGFVGEYVESAVASGSSVALTTATSANITSITLGAGDWDVRGAVLFTFGATTSYTNLIGDFSQTSATLDGVTSHYFDYTTPATVPTAAFDQAWAMPTARFSLSGSTTIFLVTQATFTVSTLKAYGRIHARRVR